MELIDAIQSRRSHKVFDASHKLTPSEIDKLM